MKKEETTPETSGKNTMLFCREIEFDSSRLRISKKSESSGKENGYV
ncbi:hypothetical protein LKD26_14955 [Faecalibacterium sp. CLA-AA-H254]|nr:hypothetical protein [Faecalibacterium hominis (ex Afrizal et al. 2022)]MCC2124401.1 hypothetical protein [Faecalibacterium hominis (ex Afrizal et al. 2022)]